MTNLEEAVPPEDLLNSIAGNPSLSHFRQIGHETLRDFVELCDLQPHERVLDVGCGVGRIASPLTQYLSPEGSYEGFDIVPEVITWCEDHIASWFPNFRFQLADIHNSRYNPHGKIPSNEYRFPYGDDEFDFVFLTSIFTHMLPVDVEHYFSEIERVLGKGGRFYATYFLLNGESLGLMAEGRSQVAFNHDFGIYRTHVVDVPEGAVAYEEDFILDLYGRHGFRVRPTLYGNWAGREDRINHQDIVIADRSGHSPARLGRKR